MVEVIKIMAPSFKRSGAPTASLSAPDPASRPPPTNASQETPGHSQASLGQTCGVLWGHCSFLLGPGVHKVLFVPSKSLFPQSCVSSVIKSHWPPKSNSLEVLSPFARSPGWEICCGSQNFLNSARIALVYPVVREKAMAPTPVLLPGKSHGQRSLVGYSPWGH